MQRLTDVLSERSAWSCVCGSRLKQAGKTIERNLFCSGICTLEKWWGCFKWKAYQMEHQILTIPIHGPEAAAGSLCSVNRWEKRLNPVQISCSHFVTAEVLNLKDLPRLQMVVCLCLTQTRRIWCCYYRSSILFNKSLSTCQKRGFCH